MTLFEPINSRLDIKYFSKANNSREKQQKHQLVAKNQSNMNHISNQSKNMANEDTLNDSHITKTHTNKTGKKFKTYENYHEYLLRKSGKEQRIAFSF